MSYKVNAGVIHLSQTEYTPAKVYTARWVPPRASIVAIFNLNRRYS